MVFKLFLAKVKHVDGGCAEAETLGDDQEWTCHDREGRSESETFTAAGYSVRPGR